jgi:hypothetical protein
MKPLFKTALKVIVQQKRKSPYKDNIALQQAQKRYNKKRYEQHEYREYHRKKEKEWVAKNRDKINAFMREYMKKYKESKKQQAISVVAVC